MGEAVPLWGRGAGPHLTQSGQAEAYLHAKFHFDPSKRLTTIHQRYRQTGQTEQERQTGQASRQTTVYSKGPTVLQTVAQKS